MSSTIVPGVSEKLGFEYLKSYLDETTAELRFIVDDESKQMRNFFSTGSNAYAFIDKYVNRYECGDHSDFSIYLNRYNSERKITKAELKAFCDLEGDEDLYEMFQAYADKMADRIDLDAEDEEEYVEEKSEDLRIEIKDITSKWCESENRLNLQLRDVAMDFIHYMEPNDFEKRLLSGNLPKFIRAVPGCEDYSEITTTKPDTFIYPKRRLTGRDVDSNIFNFAYANKEYLRCMDEADFVKLCYIY